MGTRTAMTGIARVVSKVKIATMPVELLVTAESDDYSPQQELRVCVQRISAITNELHGQFTRLERLSTQTTALQRCADADDQTLHVRVYDAYHTNRLRQGLATLHEERERSVAKIDELQSEFAFTQLIIDAILREIPD